MIRRALVHVLHRLMPAAMEAEVNHCRSKRSAATKRAKRSAQISQHIAELPASIAAQPQPDIEDDDFITMFPRLGGAPTAKG